MMKLIKIRLSYWYVFLLILFLSLAILLPKVKFEGAQLTLFSVNSFLYGFYLAPLLSGQKARIDDLAKIIRNETITLFNIRIKSKQLTEQEKEAFKALEREYIDATLARKKYKAELAYEEMVSYCLDYKGKNSDTIKQILDKLIDNQQNRTQMSMQLGNYIFSHEWIILMVLFSITLSFVLLMDSGSGIFVDVLAGLLCAGLAMLLVMLTKLSLLVHKKAKGIWEPYKELISSNYRRVY